MGTKYSRRMSDGTVEHYDSKEELEAAEFYNASVKITLMGFVIGCCVAGFCIRDVTWPQWLRVGTVLLSGTVLGAFCRRFATFILVIIGLGVFLFVGILIWNFIGMLISF